MSRYDATFEITSPADAAAVQRLLERLYDSVREELKRCDRAGSPPDETIRAFEAVYEATRRNTPGTLTLVYEADGEPFDAPADGA